MLARVKDLIIRARCVILWYNPIRFPVGLLESGKPGPDSPVLVSGNYYHTVRRLQRAVRKINCYILVADSAGINVWCAAGVCDFNEHKIADAVHSEGLAGKVAHRELILPQLGAVGIDLKRLRKESGFRGVWGPADLEDIPAFLDQGKKSDEKMRLVRFSQADRFYNAVGVFNIFLLFPFLSWLAGYSEGAHFFLAINLIEIFSIFLFYHALPFKYPTSNSVLVGVITLVAVLIDAVCLRPVTSSVLLFRIVATIMINFLVTIDMLGSTPFFKTTMGHWLRKWDNHSLFQPEILDHCTGCGECEDVCPKLIFTMEARADGNGKKIALTHLYNECIECLACVKQCPVESIINLNGDIYKHDVQSVPNIDNIMRTKPGPQTEDARRFLRPIDY